MANKKGHVLCVTCQTELPPETEIHYFAQSALFPSKNDLAFGDDLVFMINHMASLFDVIGNYDLMESEEETVKDIGKLGYEVACEARRRMKLLGAAHYAHSAQMLKLRERLVKEEE